MLGLKVAKGDFSAKSGHFWMLNLRSWRPFRLSRLPNVIQEAFEVCRNTLPRNFERASEPNLSEKAAELERISRSDRKSELPVSFRITERVVTKRLPCRNFGLRYLNLRPIELPERKAPEFLVELLVDLAHRARAKTVPAELLADRPSVVSKCASPTVAHGSCL